MRWCWLILVLWASACAPLTPGGARVSVYRAPLDGPAATRSMPEGCRLLSRTPPTSTTELDLEGQKDPFRVQRNETAAAGGNALLALTRVKVSRHDLECPGSSPITDCPPSFGAWFEIVTESYACTPDALRELSQSAVTRAPVRE